ncbi:MAG: methyl-accepting chemotaxis protein [Bdellovibrionia bacterium]
MNSIEQTYTGNVNKWMLLLVAGHLPIMMGVASFFGTGLGFAAIATAAIVAGPTVLYLMNKTSKVTSISLGVALMALSGLLIHLAQGMIEMHFHIFVMLAVMIVFANPWVIVAAAATIAVHHLGFWYFLPKSVFNYEASFWIVLVHAVFVVVESIPAVLISRKFHQIIINQGSIVSELVTLTQKMNQTASESSATAVNISAGTEQQAASIQSTAAALYEITRIVELNTENAKQAAKLSQESNQIAVEGERNMTELMEMMNQITSSSKKIAEIINVIEDIAFQTNLLALNASVEAARAGEQGRGFAVVADAVRTLAHRSSSAAKDITKLIQDSVEQISMGQKIANKSGDSLTKILKSVEKVASLNGEISTASEEQSQGIRDIKSNVESLEASTNESTQISMNSAKSAQELSEQAQVLNELVETLKSAS